MNKLDKRLNRQFLERHTQKNTKKTKTTTKTQLSKLAQEESGNLNRQASNHLEKN